MSRKHPMLPSTDPMRIPSVPAAAQISSKAEEAQALTSRPKPSAAFWQRLFAGGLLLPLCLVAMVAMSGCRGAQVRSEAEVIHRQLEKVRQDGAYRCSPRELAVAEANYAFAGTELRHGEAERAAKHVELAAAALDRAKEAARECVKEVHIREAPVVVSVVVRDSDGDGIPDDQDECPNEPGIPELKGCPPVDSDGDGIFDHLDACPDEPGPPEFDGCPPPDRDGDGIPDHLDKCPDEPGPPEFDGCPPLDSDGDGIPDHLDKCPFEPGVIEEQGCPRKYTLVVLKKERIEISEQVHFATGKHQILKDSFELLNQIVQVLEDHPTIKLRIEGHTDSVGNEAFNLRLSQQRADSVREYLIEAGIDSERLESLGYGPSMPIASNANEAGRSQNRRVEFNISEQ